MPRKGLRLFVLAAAVVLVFTVYVQKLIQVQIVSGEEYAAQVNKGSQATQTVAAARGEILDRNGVPLAINTTGYNVVLDWTFLPRDRQNEVILSLTKVLSESETLGSSGEKKSVWIDNLPITQAPPFKFLSGDKNSSDVARLKSRIGVAEYATVDDVMYNLIQKYKLEDFSPADQRIIAGIRYEMERRGFSRSVRYTVAENVSISTVAKIKELSHRLPGVDVEESPIRQYVAGTTAPHIIGYIGPIYQEEWADLKDKGYEMNDQVGKAGVESAFEETLRGRDGERKITMNAQGDPIEVETTKEPEPGNTIVLTIDSGLQQTIMSSLERQIQLLNATANPGEGREADRGCAVAIECKTGEILAAANFPSYDMDTYRFDYASLESDPRQPLFNHALEGTYAPGSVFKPVTATAALNEGLITAADTVTCNRVYTRFEAYRPTCLGSHGAITVLTALQKSCNIFFYEMGYRLKVDKMIDYAAQYGLGQPTGIEIKESIGHISSPEAKAQIEAGAPWSGGDDVQTAIGQLYHRFTPLQLANYAATIGNRGKRMEAHIIKSIKSYDFTETVQEKEPKIARTLDVRPDVFETVNQGMVMATGPGGTSNAYLGDYPIPIASKTGTPQTILYPNSTFIAYAPANDPEIAVAVVIEKGWHGYTGAPVARDIFNYYFNAKNQESAPPDYGVLLP